MRAARHRGSNSPSSSSGGRAGRVPDDNACVDDDIGNTEDEPEDFVVSHPMTRICFAGKRPRISLSTIVEESFSSLDSTLECVDLAETPVRDNRSVVLPTHLDHGGAEDEDASPTARPEESKHATSSDLPVPRAPGRGRSHCDLPVASYRHGRWTASRVVRGFWVVIVSMLVVDVVLFVIAYAWTTMFIFALILLGMILGMLLSAVVWYLAVLGPRRGDFHDDNACDLDAVSNCTHFPNPHGATPSTV